jgi:hypothetical protein
MLWEALHAGECAKPTLLRFQGKPHDLRSVAGGLTVRLCTGVLYGGRSTCSAALVYGG